MTTGGGSRLESITPFFIVGNLAASLEFYGERLGFATEVALPEEEPFFAMIRRDRVAIMLKEIGPETPPLPNSTRHEQAPWDAWIHTPDPDASFRELEGRSVDFHRRIEDTPEGLRLFQIRDPDGYVLCFGRPLREPG